LGVDELYEPSHLEGFQVVRYQSGQAYTTHSDYMRGKKDQIYNFDTAGVGGNRLATILLYLNDVPKDAGGETLFQIAPQLGSQTRPSREEAIAELRASGEAGVLDEGSWEEEMTSYCRSRLAIKPKKGRAILFYSQTPAGDEDRLLFHGGCPVLDAATTKWAANIWVWSAPNPLNSQAPLKWTESPEEKARRVGGGPQLQVTFKNSGTDRRYDQAKLYYQDIDFGVINSEIRVNTFEGHEWTIRSSSSNEVLRTYAATNQLGQELVV
jgi:hypothetical protein